MTDTQALKYAIGEQADFIEKLDYSELNDRTIFQAKLILLDSLGCMAVGNSQYSEERFPEGKYLLVGGKRTDKLESAFMNGSAMVKNELDEGNQFAFGHPACHILPALIAEEQEVKASGKQFISAMVAAYETSCRWGCSAKTRPEMHVHGTMQTMGGAAAVCKLHGEEKKNIESAIVLANSLPQSTSWSSAFHGDQLRNAYIGMCAQVGLQTRGMLQAGIESSVETLVHLWEQVLGGSINPVGLTENLGQTFYMDTNYFKVHAACRYTHSFVDILKEFMSKGLDRKDIERIEIGTYKAASKLSGKDARNSFAMRFSIPMASAICLKYGNLDMSAVSEEHVSDEEVKALAQKIFVNENEEYTKLLPEIRRNKITVFTTGGQIFEKDASVTKGDYLDPFSEEEIIEKFNNLTEGIWDKQRRDAIVESVFRLESLENLDELFGLLEK